VKGGDVVKGVKLLSAAAVILAVAGVAVTVIVAQEKSEDQTIDNTVKSVLYKEAQCDKGKLKVVNGLPVLYLCGTGKDMGKQYGTILKKLLTELASAAKQLFADEQEELMAKSLAPQIEKFIPEEYVAEMKAISEAAGIDYLTVLIVNALGEMKCSTISVWGERTKDGKILFGRNLDKSLLPTISDKIGCVTVYCREGKNSVASVGVTGLIGVYSGMNDKGLSLANTTSVNAKQSIAIEGMPPGLLYRYLLENCATVEDAKKELSNLKHNVLCASTLMICDAQGKAIVAELGPGGVAIREPKGTIIYATNHFLTEKMKETDVSCWRYAKFEEVEKKNEKLDTESMKKILQAVVQEGATLHSIIFEPADKKIHIAFHKRGKPAAETKYSLLTVNDLFPGPAGQDEKNPKKEK
jgi:predicted choloylglycine hydrolase